MIYQKLKGPSPTRQSARRPRQINPMEGRWHRVLNPSCESYQSRKSAREPERFKSGEDYQEFLQNKSIIADPVGIEVSEVHQALYDFQRDIVKWAVRRGRAAVFADCGLGKTLIQVDWARLVTKRRCLILAPLNVSFQTKELARDQMGIEVHVCKDQFDVCDGINITNYEKIHHFSPDFDSIVLDESSILKSFDGKYRQKITEFASSIPYRLCCTATPAPNDFLELTNHSEFLDIMTGKEIIALFFTQDGNSSHKFRLKRHAEEDFWKWMASWSVAIRKPSDLGYEDGGFILPELRFHDIEVDGPSSQNTLFDMGKLTLQERREARRLSIEQRVKACADVVNDSDEQWLVWCDLNEESRQLKKAIPDAVEVKGSDSISHKEKALSDFTNQQVRVLVTKPSIAGFGMNWQQCHNMAFVGLSDSFEQIYQATRRCWRFGQKEDVNCYVITSKAEGAVRSNIERKERQYKQMFKEIVRHMKGRNLDQSRRMHMEYEEDYWEGEHWNLYLGDSVKRIDEIEDESVGLTVFSPPFPSMYAYTNSPADMGNVKSIDEMIDHFRFLGRKMLQVTMPGRSCCIHLTQSPAFKSVDGYIGIKDFRGAVINMMQEEGWIYYGEVCIDKDPQVKAIRTKDRGLLFKTLSKDSAHMHMALADYLLQFRKPGDNPEPIKAGISKRYANEDGWITPDEWIEWAAPVWYRETEGMPGGIRETDVLNVEAARDQKDERHLCPLQLGVIERAIKLWSNPGDVVFSPFAGVGSEGYQAVKFKRRFVGIELKRSYADTAIKNLERAESEAYQPDLFEAEAQ